MAKVHITNVLVMDNPSSFFSPFSFELTFECIEELNEDLEFKMIYVGSAESEEHDQVLDTIYVGPVPEGRHIFVFQAEAPDCTKIPEPDVVGVTIVLITCKYRGQEFVRVGYYVNNDYTEPELRENPPPKPIFEKLQRNILASKPRVTRFKINWDDNPNYPMPPLPPLGVAQQSTAEETPANNVNNVNNMQFAEPNNKHSEMLDILRENDRSMDDSLAMPLVSEHEGMTENSNSNYMD